MFGTTSPAQAQTVGVRSRGFGTAMVMGVLLGMLTAEGLLLRQVASHRRLVLVEPWDDGDEVVSIIVTAPAAPSQAPTAKAATAPQRTLVASAAPP